MMMTKLSVGIPIRKHRNITKFLFIIFIISALWIEVSSGQSEIKKDGKITGSIIDSDSLHSLPGVSIILFKTADSSIVKGTYSDSKGKFSFDRLPFGSYYLKISCVGYEIKYLNSIIISENNLKNKIGKIKLNSKVIGTEDVEITGQKEFIQVNPDKLVVQVDRSLVASGGSAIDALRNIPVISVDVDDNVKLRGSDNIQFLIDGKPSNIADADFLEVIPASSIDKIEIITNPSSKYDADGNAGIINLILKKEEPMVTSGQIIANAGTADKYAGSALFGISGDKLSFFMNYTAKSHNMIGSSEQIQERFYILDSGLTCRDQVDFQKKRNQGVRFGLDYRINKYNSLSLTGLYIHHNKDISKNRQYDQFDNNMNFIDYHEKSILNNNLHNNFDLNLNYNLKFDTKGHEINVGTFYSPAGRVNNYIYDHKYFTVQSSNIIPDNKPDLLERSKANTEGYNWTLQSDYSLPLNAFSKFESGYKSIIKNSDMDFGFENFITPEWLNDSTRSNKFHYREVIHSLYAIYTNKILDLHYNIGLRAEYAIVQSKQITTRNDYNTDYFELFPSLQVKYDLSEFSNLRFSASRRINRPGMKQLNPFINYSDPQELSSGNPYLKQELTQQYEIGYYHLLPSTTFLINLFLKSSNNPFTVVTTLIDSNITLSQPVNYDGSTNFGSEIIISHQLFYWLKIDGNICYYDYYLKGNLEGSPEVTKHNNSWTAKFTGNASIGKICNVQLAINYFSAITNLQSRSGEYYSADIGLKVNIIKNRLAFNVKANDIFHTLKSSNDIFNPYFIISNTRQKESRYLIAGLTWNFNTVPERFKNNKDENSEMDSNEENPDDEE